jgi:hypothetical protein
MSSAMDQAYASAKLLRIKKLSGVTGVVRKEPASVGGWVIVRCPFLQRLLSGHFLGLLAFEAIGRP